MQTPQIPGRILISPIILTQLRKFIPRPILTEKYSVYFSDTSDTRKYSSFTATNLSPGENLYASVYRQYYSTKIYSNSTELFVSELEIPI